MGQLPIKRLRTQKFNFFSKISNNLELGLNPANGLGKVLKALVKFRRTLGFGTVGWGFVRQAKVWVGFGGDLIGK